MNMPKTTISSKKYKILLVDNDEFIKITFRDIFWIHGLEEKYDILTAASFDEAEKNLARGFEPDMILLDILMPTQEQGKITTGLEAGINFIKRIKNDQKLERAVVVVFSSVISADLKKQVLSAGADKILRKDESFPHEILEEIRRCLETA